MPRTGAPPTMGERPTTGAAAAAIASRMPGTARMVPTETTGLDGGKRITSAAAIASSTPGAGLACSAPTGTTASASTEARSRTQYSWKCRTRRSPVPASVTATWVSTRSSDMGSSRTPGCQRSQRASVTALSG